MSSVIELLQKSWELYRRYFGLLGGYVAWLLLPYVGLVLTNSLPASIFADALAIIFLLAQTILSVWIVIALVLLVDYLLKNPQTKNILPKHFPDHAWKLILPLLFVAIIQTAVDVGGLILLILPGLVFMVWFSFSQLSVIIDGKRGIKALYFSRELVRGNFWPIAWRIVAGPALISIIYLLITSVMILIIASVSGNTELLNQNEAPVWVDAIGTVIEIFSMPLYLIYFIIFYEEVKSTKNEMPKVMIEK